MNNMRKLQLISLLLVVVALSSCSGSKKLGEEKLQIQFEKSDVLTDAIEKAQSKNAPIFIDFYTTWCLPCRVMDEEVFSQKGVINFYNKNFVNMKVNAEKNNGPNLKFLYGIQGYPTFVVVDHNGTEIKRHQGSLTYSGLLEFGRSAKALFDAQQERN